MGFFRFGSGFGVMLLFVVDVIRVSCEVALMISGFLVYANCWLILVSGICILGFLGSVFGEW